MPSARSRRRCNSHAGLLRDHRPNTGRGEFSPRPVSFSSNVKCRCASGEQTAQWLLTGAALDELADVGRARRGRARRGAGPPTASRPDSRRGRVPRRPRVRARARDRRSPARGAGTRCGTRRTCPCRRDVAACAARRGGAGAGRPRSQRRQPPPRRAPTPVARRRSRPRAENAAAPGRPPRRAPISARQSQRSSAVGSVSSRSPAGSATGSMRDAIELVRVVLERQRQQLERIGGRRVGGTHRDEAAPARGFQLGVAGAHRSGEPGRIGERRRRAACEPSGARRQCVTGDQREHQGDAVARLGEDHRDAARPRVLDQAPRILAQRLEHPFAPLRRAELRQSDGIHCLVVGRPAPAGLASRAARAWRADRR